MCQGEMEGVPEVTVTLTPMDGVVIHDVLQHCSVQNEDFEGTFRLTFQPAVHSFELARYLIQRRQLPLRGFFQMKTLTPTEVKFLIQLKLEADVSNELAYCRVIVPLRLGGPIVSFTGSPTAGSVDIRADRRALVWEIGTKFTGRNLEAALPASVHFESLSGPPPSGEELEGEIGAERNEEYLNGENGMQTTATTVEDVSCVGKEVTGTIIVEFKLLNYAHVTIQPQNVAIFPKGMPVQLVLEKSLAAGRYIIWNSWAQPRVAYAPP